MLAAVFEATNGSLWKDNTNWLTTAPLEEWFGVRLDDDGRIVHLLLTDNGLIGSHPTRNRQPDETWSPSISG